MAHFIAVAADVDSATLTKQMNAQVSSAGTQTGSKSARRRFISSSQMDRPLFGPNLSSWLRSPSKHTSSALSGAASPSAEDRVNTSASSAAKRPRLRTYSLRDKTTARANGQMTSPRSNKPVELSKPLSSPNQPGASTYSPTTPAFYPSPTSPNTPAAPTTPPKPSVSHTISSPSLLRYGAFSYNGVVYSTPKYTPSRGDTRQRSSTWSSIGSSLTQSPVGVSLPIGQKSSRWAEQEPVTTCTPIDLTEDDGEYEGEDEDDDEEEEPVGVKHWLAEVQASPPLQRPPRPAGPRAMSASPKGLNGLGLGLEERSISYRPRRFDVLADGSDADSDIDRSRRARRRGVDFASNSRFSEAFSLSSGSIRFSRLDEDQLDEVEEEEGIRDVPEHRQSCDELADSHGDEEGDFSWEAQERNSPDGNELARPSLADPQETQQEDFSWEAQECDSSDNVDSPLLPEELVRPACPSPLSPASCSSHTHMGALDYKPISHVESELSVYDTRSATEASPLGDAFDLSNPTEVSSFDSDSEDEDAPSASKGKLRRMRSAIRNSVSLPSLRSRLSFHTSGSTPSSSSSSSPESVTSLRTRQLTNAPSPGRNPYILRLATDVALSTIPASPIEMPSDTRSQCSDIPTPATPVSPEISNPGSFFFWNLGTRNTLYPPDPPPRKRPSVSGKPPNLPLPPTPPLLSSPYTPPRLRLRSNAAEMRDQCLTVVDPDTSMARLEMSIARLEAHAPSVANENPDLQRGKHDRKPPAPKDAIASVNNGEDRHGTAVVMPIAPSKLSHPSHVSLSSASTSAPSSSGSSSSASGLGEPFVIDLKPSPPLAADSKGKGKGMGRPPSLALLPKFDFERPGHQVLDLRGLPPRSASLTENREHPLAGGEDTGSSRFSESDRLSSPSSAGRSYSPRTPPRQVAWDDSHEGLSSFMLFTPRQPEPRSRVRRLLDRVHVPGELIRGLRGSFGPPGHQVS